MKLRAKDVSMISVLAATYAVLTLIPGIPIIGGKGRINLAASIAPVFGIALGPWKGALAALVGTSIALVLPSGTPTPIGLLFLPAPVISSLVAGLASSRGGSPYRRAAAPCILGALVAGWYATWVGRAAPLYPVPHIVALALALALWKLPKRARTEYLVPLVSYCGLMADHMYGNLAFIQFAGLFMPVESIPGLPALFMAVLPISVAERLLMTAIASLVGVSLLKAMRVLGIEAGA